MVGGCTNEGVEMLIGVNMGGRAEVMFIRTLETGRVVLPQTANILTPTPHGVATVS